MKKQAEPVQEATEKKGKGWKSQRYWFVYEVDADAQTLTHGRQVEGHDKRAAERHIRTIGEEGKRYIPVILVGLPVKVNIIPRRDVKIVPADAEKEEGA